MVYTNQNILWNLCVVFGYCCLYSSFLWTTNCSPFWTYHRSSERVVTVLRTRWSRYVTVIWSLNMCVTQIAIWNWETEFYKLLRFVRGRVSLWILVKRNQGCMSSSMPGGLFPGTGEGICPDSLHAATLQSIPHLQTVEISRSDSEATEGMQIRFDTVLSHKLPSCTALNASSSPPSPWPRRIRHIFAPGKHCRGVPSIRVVIHYNSNERNISNTHSNGSSTRRRNRAQQTQGDETMPFSCWII